MTDDWILHFDERTRSLAYAVVEGVASSLAALAAPVWTAMPARPWLNESIDLALPRAATLQGRKREAHFSITGDNLSLTVSGKGEPGLDIPFSISGALVDADGRIAVTETNDPTTNVTSTLAHWQAGLTKPIDSEHVRKAEAYRAVLARLGLGVVTRSGLDWRWFSLDPGSGGVHTMSVWSHSQGSLEYGSPTAMPTGRRLSQELSDEIDRIVGGRIHVTEGYFRKHSDELPLLIVGYWSSGPIHAEDMTDRTAMLRAVEDLPAGARLLEQ